MKIKGKPKRPVTSWDIVDILLLILFFPISIFFYSNVHRNAKKNFLNNFDTIMIIVGIVAVLLFIIITVISV